MRNLETLIEGSRVRFGSVGHDDEKGGKEYFLKVSFPMPFALTSTWNPLVKRTRP
jgi:hypothetical protein